MTVIVPENTNTIAGAMDILKAEPENEQRMIVMIPGKAYDFDFRVEDITEDQAEILLATIQMVVEGWGATLAGGCVEVGDDEED